MRPFSILLLLANIAALAAAPNFVLILCDDLGYGDLACYGHPQIKTPNLDRMAADGLKLSACYSSAPVCSPSRVGLLTGRSPNRAGVYDWIPPAGKARPDARHMVHMRRSEVTIAHLLKGAGYATAMAGKWHCNSRFNHESQPQPGDAGFDHWMATQNNASPSHRNPRNYVRNGKAVGATEGYSCNLAAAEGIAWLRKQQAAAPEQPFFLFLPFHEPHEPVASPPDLVAEYADVAKDGNQAEYFANVANVDRAVGSVLAALDELKLAENTLVIFTSDNGPETLRRYGGAGRSYGVPGPLRGMKLWTSEAGFRVAGIMRWPARIKPGSTYDGAVSALDFLPTFCDLAGVARPDRVLDGSNFLPALEGKPIPRERPLLWAYYNAINERRVAMRDGDWKILARLQDLPKTVNLFSGNSEKVRRSQLVDFQIYKLSEDIGEARELSAEFPEKAAELRSKLQTEYKALLADSHVWGAQGH
jgi:arylsulfatase A